MPDLGHASAAPAPAALAGRRVWVVSPTQNLRESLADVIQHAGASAGAFATLPAPAALASAGGQTGHVLLADERALAAAGLDAKAWAAQLEAAGLPGVLLVGLAAPPQGLPAGLGVVHKPARPAPLIEALQHALNPAAATAAPAPSAIVTGSVAVTRACRVLLVDDHPVNQIIARTMLEGLGAQVVVAGGGLEAIGLFTQPAGGLAFELVLMDCQMPELDGMACTRRLREIEVRQDRRRTPIVAMPADTEAEVGAACIAAGMDAFLAKPVRLEQLQDVIARWAPAGVGHI